MNSLLSRIFFPLNVDDNCRLISRLLQPVKLQIYHHLQAGEDHEAVLLFGQLLETMSHAFIKDRHYLYIDNMYAPDVDCSDIFHWFQHAIEDGSLSVSSQKLLSEIRIQIKASDSFKEYKIPSIC